jgi:hypothetical protein
MVLSPTGRDFVIEQTLNWLNRAESRCNPRGDLVRLRRRRPVGNAPV